MISFGSTITTNKQPMVQINVDEMYRQTLDPQPDTAALIRQLRVLRTVDKEQYSRAKRKLPYYTCGIFSPAQRSTENFAYTKYFILDIDHLTEKGCVMADLRNRIASDSRVLMVFASPSMDGLKVMFRLKQRCYDPGMYSLFYRKFAMHFARKYGIEQVIDTRTCDVTRACFASYDPQAYYNPDADPIDLEAFVGKDGSWELIESQREVEMVPMESESRCDDMPHNPEPGDEVMANVRAILTPRRAIKDTQTRPVYVPAQLEEVAEDLVTYVAATGVEVLSMTSIQYGKKIKSKIGSKHAETNVFYGKNGFTVVESPKKGTDPEINQLVGELIESFFDTL